VGGSWARTGIPAALTSATYNAGNQLTARDATSFTYDLNGNLASDGLTSYTWNARDQLVGLSGGASASFAYDGLRRRRRKTVSGTTTNFLYDGWNFVQEQASGGTPTANLLTGLGIDQTFTRTDSAGTSSPLVDALGSALERADASGTLQTHYTFEPFGATTTSGAASTNAQQFTGRENDGSGLYFYRARFYSPGLQRFLAEDPLEFGGGDVNLSAYVQNDPVSKSDPFGLYVKNCTDQPKKVKPEHGGEPPFILPPMTECPDCHPDGVAPVSPDAPWTKIPSPERYPADVTVYPGPGATFTVVCSLTSICRYWPFRPFIPSPGSGTDKAMRADPDWWKPPVGLPPNRTRPLGRKDCEQ
jgi:RHS repeat-associated protein